MWGCQSLPDKSYAASEVETSGGGTDSAPFETSAVESDETQPGTESGDGENGDTATMDTATAETESTTPVTRDTATTDTATTDTVSSDTVSSDAGTADSAAGDSDTDSSPDDTDALANIRWRTVSSGQFWMGSPDTDCPQAYPGACRAEEGRMTDEALHLVSLTCDFEMMETEVTQEMFVSAMGWNPSYFSDTGEGNPCGDRCPVESVSWYDMLAFANEVSIHNELPHCYLLTSVSCVSGQQVAEYMDCMTFTARGIASAEVYLNDVATPYTCEGVRLPTEAEWEFAARAGTLTPFHESASQDGAYSAEKGWTSGTNAGCCSV